MRGVEFERDRVDALLETWAKRRPELDLSPIGVTRRIYRLARHLEHTITDEFRTFGTDWPDLLILEALERSGPDGRVTPTELGEELMMTSGGMTARLSRLQRADLIERLPDSADRRVLYVGLTPKGRDLVGRLLPLYARVKHQCLEHLDADTVSSLEDGLRSMLLGFERTPPRMGPTWGDEDLAAAELDSSLNRRLGRR